jgi:hypothetical protein
MPPRLPLLLALLLPPLAGCYLDAGHTTRFIPLSVDRSGCNPRDFSLSVRRSGFRGGRYEVRTQVVVDGRVYMDERASVFKRGLSDWILFDDFSHGAVTQPGRWPLPRGRAMRIEFTLQRPEGTVLDRQTLVIDACDSGRVLYRTPVFRDGMEA